MKANNPEASLKKGLAGYASATEGTRGSKDNSECASLRDGNLPKAEAVRTVSSNTTEGVKAARKQLRNDGKEDALSVIPNDRIPAPPNTHGAEK